MKKQLLVAAGLMAFASAAQAQYPLVRVSDIQTVSAADLANCLDAPGHVGDTVRVQGIVITPGGLAQSASGRQIWIRDIDSQGEFHSIGVRYGGGNNPTTPTDLLNVVPGDTLEITAQVQEYNGTSATSPTNDGETQLVPLTDGVRNIGDGTGPAPTANLLANIGILNDAQRLNNLPTGEGWEGAFIEVQNVTVVSVNLFSSGTRVSFTVADGQGNQMEVSDRFLAGRFSTGFVAPSVGDQFTSLKGVIIHSKNRCAGTASANRGYTLNPFDATHYVRGASAPSIGGITRLPAQPCSTTPTTISATITDDGSVASAILFYAIGETGPYTQSPMTVTTGSIYSAAIPGQADGTFVRYYIRATDNLGNVTNIPNVPTASPTFYVSRCGGPTVRDIQYTPYADGNSGYKGTIIDGLEGVVVSSATDLGQVFIQDPTQTSWNGIWLFGSATATLNRGDRVRVSGTVEENFNVTRVNVASGTVTVLSSGNPISSITLDPSVLSTYDFTQNEKYESCLVKVQMPNGTDPLFVVDSNVRAAGSTSNFGEYRLGGSLFDPANGVVVQVGNQNSTNFSTLNASYINAPRWATNLRVAPIVVTQGQPLVTSITGVVYYGFNTLMMLPRDNPDFALYTGVDEVQADAEFKFLVSPNPFVKGNYVYINSGYNSPSDAWRTGGSNSCNCVVWRGVYVVVTGSDGVERKVDMVDVDGTLRLDITNLPSGVYNIRFVDPFTEQSTSEQFIIL